MRLILAITLTATLALLVSSEATEEEVGTLPPIKIDKNLRKALLKALEDLEAESADPEHTLPTTESFVMKVTDDLEVPEPFKDATFSFFPSEGSEGPGEDKLQNSSFVETEKLQVSDAQLSEPQMEKVAFQKYDVLLGDKEIIEKSPEPQPVDQILTRSVKTSGSKVNAIDQSPKDEKESLSVSPSNGIVSASANALIAPSPTPPSPTVKPAPTQNLTSATATEKPEESEVKIFQAPLVAAFTVQQDEQGIAKSVLPLYKPGTDNQGLSLQEQLDFKQHLLEKQLAELQAQHAQQTQFLLKQQELYQEQLRQKQRHHYYLQEQARLKQLEEQRKLQAQQLEEQKVQQLRQQAQFSSPQGSFSQNSFLAFQSPVKTQNIQFQPSIALQLPNANLPPAFQPNPVHEQLRLQQFQRQQIIQQHAQQLQLQRQQAVLLQQQRLQQSFPGFQFELPAPVQATRFNRQEAFGAVGNLGINDNRQSSRNHLPLEPPRISPQPLFAFNQFNFRQQQRPQTPASQIQNLLFQSGVAGGLNAAQGHTNEDLNIVSKVLALNVGAVPLKNLKYHVDNFARA